MIILDADLDNLKGITKTSLKDEYSQLSQATSNKHFTRASKELLHRFYLLSRICNKDSSLLDRDSREFIKLDSVIEIRHRITHPKYATELEISDGELKEIREVMDWYSRTIGDTTRLVNETFFPGR